MSTPNANEVAGPPCPADLVWTAFLSALEVLPAEARLALLLHDVAGLSIDALMPVLGLPAAGCRQRLEQAHACLRDHACHLGVPPACP